MALRRFFIGWIWIIAATVAVNVGGAIAPHPVHAQDDTTTDDTTTDDSTDDSTDDTTDDTSTDTGTGNGSTVGAGDTSGVAIDANGVLQRVWFPDPTGLVRRQRLLQSVAQLDAELTKPSKLRKVSLTRLEKEIARLAAEGKEPTHAMQSLAGLTRLQYVFFYPETGDIVIAGPAEPFAEDLSGRVIGLKTGSPVLLLEDMVVAMRAYAPGGRQKNVIFCSIDPTEQGLANMQKFLRNVGRNITPNQTVQIVRGLQQSLGLQEVTLGGIPPESHFAEVIVEADYRMKLIGIGLEQTPVGIKSYTERSNPRSSSQNALHRWYFVPDYQCVRVGEDNLGMELVGRGVKLIGEEEFVSAEGKREDSRRVDRASEQFVNEFTKKYAALAARVPVYAQLRNLIDMSIAASFIQQQDYYGQAGWKLGVLGDESTYAAAGGRAPKQVPTAVNGVWKGRRFLTPVGGGVQISAHQALDEDNLISTDAERVTRVRDGVQLDSLPEGTWWWD